jgi:uncharacterized membrane protein YvbJ
MNSQLLQEVACPNCQYPIDIREHGRHVTCEACNSRFILQGHLCPYCSSYHKEEASFCRECGAALMRSCGRCGTSNWAGDEYCVKCGEALDIMDLLTRFQHNSRLELLEKRQEEIRRIREIEEEATRRRAEELEAIEEERLLELRRRKEKQQTRERKLLLLAGGVVVAFIILMLLYSAVASVVLLLQ